MCGSILHSSHLAFRVSPWQIQRSLGLPLGFIPKTLLVTVTLTVVHKHSYWPKTAQEFVVSKRSQPSKPQWILPISCHVLKYGLWYTYRSSSPLPSLNIHTLRLLKDCDTMANSLSTSVPSSIPGRKTGNEDLFSHYTIEPHSDFRPIGNVPLRAFTPQDGYWCLRLCTIPRSRYS